MNLLQGREYEVASFQVLSLVSACDCSAYTCEFVALAQDLEAPLITVDKKILSEFPSLVYGLVEYVSLREIEGIYRWISVSRAIERFIKEIEKTRKSNSSPAAILLVRLRFTRAVKIRYARPLS